MKTLTLKEAFDACILMWEWVVEKWIASGQLASVLDLKLEYGELSKIEEIYGGEIKGCCFFCEYSVQISGDGDGGCSNCPGILIDPAFQCVASEYSYRVYPDLFLDKVKVLYKEGIEKGIIK